MTEKRYQPKGGMCASCIRGSAACSSLPFHTMQVIHEHDDCFVVRCTEYQRKEKAE